MMLAGKTGRVMCIVKRRFVFVGKAAGTGGSRYSEGQGGGQVQRHTGLQGQGAERGARWEARLGRARGRTPAAVHEKRACVGRAAAPGTV